MKTVNFHLNEQPCSLEVHEGENLLHALRRGSAVRSCKDGCSPQGQCGCCLALVDGRALTTCAMPAGKAEGKSIVTLEGLPQERRQLYAEVFAETAALQCGFCIPGIILRAHHLLEKTPEPSEGDIRKALDGHLCRCTGYVKIIEAIQKIGHHLRSGEAPPQKVWEGKVGDSPRRYQALETALGDRAFVDDLRFPGMLQGAVLYSPVARGKVIKIDTSAAAALEGVVCVATAADVPGQRSYGLLRNDWPGLIAEGEEVRYVGDVLAVVAALDRPTARRAIEAIVVEVEAWDPVVDAEEALKPGAPIVNPFNPTPDNVLSFTQLERGDCAQALSESAHTIEGVWETQRIEHLFLEPEAAVVVPTETGFKLYSQGQGVFDDQRQISAFLGLEKDQFQVELVPNGGAFGGKEDLSIQAHAALLAYLTRKPVQLTLSREESVRMHPKRHPLKMYYRAGCDSEGRLTAVEARIFGDSGAYASVGAKVLERAAGHACGPYRVPNVSIQATAAYTNNPPCGAMRGFGVNQTSFAIEGCLDQLAQKCGLDGWTMRMRNVIVEGDPLTTGQVLKAGVGVKATLEHLKEAYFAALSAGRSVGIACGIKNTGIGNGVVEWGKCRLVVEPDQSVSLYIGYTEMGQGLLTIASQFAAEATGLPYGVFRPKVDSTFALDCGQTTGSRATFFVGKAVLSAGAKLREALAQSTLEQLSGQVFAADEIVDDTTKLGDTSKTPKTHSAYSFATQMCILDEAGRVEKLIAVHDVGRVVNRALCEGQLEGSLHMGLGYALSEDLPCLDGMPVTAKLREIGALRAQDMPAVEVVLLEIPSDEGPMGVKGVGEIGLVPTASAVAGALFMHDGIQRYRLPMKSSPAGQAVSVGRIKAAQSDRWR